MSSGLSTMFTGRCPICHEGKLFTGVYEIRERCEVCGAVYYRDPGSWTGATVVAYVAGSVFLVVFLLWMFVSGLLAQKGSEWYALGAVTIFQLGAFRFAKAFWVGVLADMDQIYPDDPSREEPSAPS